MIRCYDGNVSSGSLKFTLRLPATSTTNNEDDVLVSSATKDEEEGSNNKFSLRKLIFISSASESSSSSTPRPTYLCGMRDVSSILLYDIERGVLASTINIRNEEDNSNKKDSKNEKKKKRKSSIMMNGGVLCDIATNNSNNTLYALIYFPTSNDDDEGDNNDDESSSAKCRVYEYNLSDSNNGQEPRLVRKIKVGSVVSLSSSNSGGLSFGIHVSSITSTLIVKLGNVLRVIDLSTGSRVTKVDIPPSINHNNNGGGGGSAAFGTTIPSFVPLCVSNDGRHVVTPIDNNRVVLLSYDNTKLRILTTLSTGAVSEDGAIASIDMTYLNSGKKLVVSALSDGIAYIFEINLEEVQKTSLVPQMPYMPMIKLQTTSKINDSPSPMMMNLVSATFHPRTPETTILCLFQRSTSLVNRGGSVAGSGITTLPMETVPYVGNKGTVIVGTSMLLIKNTDITTDAMKSKKRKVEGSAVALTPGDQGREASMAADLSSSLQTKKNKKGNADDDDDDDMENKLAKDDDKKKETEDANNNDDEEEMEEDGEQGQTIAERLALLSSAMEESDDDDDYNEDEGIGGQGMDSSSMTTTTDKSKFNTKSATSATLTTLLTQALSSNDPTQLNVALQVTDRRLVEGTVLSLQSLDAERGSSNDNNDEEDAIVTAGYIPTLMAHLVRRMARRHSLVMPLGVWVKAILAATARSTTYQVLSTATRGGDNNKNDDAVAERMAREGREMAMKLGPLKNFLNERVECFPQLLRLEGRLSLLNQQL